jgi:hypothetical protein
MARRPPIERVWRRVERGKKDECWPWAGKVRPDGYGEVRINKTVKQLAHRVVYADAHGGKLTDGMVVHHTCENKLCCNPAHLEALTWIEHSQLHSSQSYLR